tara:strand:- start:7862 stop:8266 length:405 start_codon:yes stop_codon:yes gene_type:complete
MKKKKYPINKSEEEWSKILTKDEFYIMRKKGTERPFSGEYNMHFKNGIYACRSCNQELYNSSSKFDSSCGWPSFDNAIPNSTEYVKDFSHGMIRTEILCSNCGSHQGHLFYDGPTKTGKRYCVNSYSIKFIAKK